DVTNADVTDLMYRVQRSRNSAMEAARKGAVLMYTSANFPNNTPDELARMLDEHMTLARKRIYDVDVKDLNIRGSKGGRSPIVVS
ncbi:hypothetical protein COU56_04080, partial [Candidatus Pacearchaeota archaeon CG10_big_fil_rev_8_21_14_0_10_31_9]